MRTALRWGLYTMTRRVGLLMVENTVSNRSVSAEKPSRTPGSVVNCSWHEVKAHKPTASAARGRASRR